MRYSYLTAAVMAGGLLVAAPVFAQSTSGSAQPGKQTTQQAKKQHTDGEDVTGNNNFAPSTIGAKKQRTDGEDVTGNRNFPAASR